MLKTESLRKADANCSARIAICTVLLVINGNARSYEQPTHVTLTERAFYLSEINTDVSQFNRLNFTTALNLTDDGIRRIVKHGLMTGAHEEDYESRPLNHFFNPLTQRGISACPPFNKCESSPQWMIWGSQQLADPSFAFAFVYDELVLSYDNAIARYYRAITGSDKDSRELDFSRMSINLGHVVHHIQDMAQPQHVRDESHCDAIKCGAAALAVESASIIAPIPILTQSAILEAYAGAENNKIFSPSAYENFSTRIDKCRINSSLPPCSGIQDGLITPHISYDSTKVGMREISSASSFWLNDALNGMANITNSGFVTDGTNFITCNSNPAGYCARKRFPNPAPENTTIEPSGLVMNNQTGKHLSTYSAVSNQFFITESNMAEANDFLLPRAIAYSTALLNFFFRGRIDIAAASDLTVIVTNTGDDLPSGQLEVYKDLSYRRDLIKDFPILPIAGLKHGESISIGKLKGRGYGFYTIVFKPANLCNLNTECKIDKLGTGVVAAGTLSIVPQPE